MPHDLEVLKESLVGLGTTKVAHLDGTLLAHMVNVYRGLERFGCPEHVMLAGLFHGVYGTHALQATGVFELQAGQREHVRALVGAPAERLVYNFCVMTYESLGRSMRNVLRKGGRPELQDRCTGALADVTLEDFRELLWVKLADLLAHIPQLPPETRDMVVADYGPFWQLVAEYLGPAAVSGWNDVLGDVLRIQPRRRLASGAGPH
ncbi:DUF6817 domain-containing protein [Corallococcus sp. Z5C101001]|uniref:DUF6817 domain-containing protein n=1 Tax=Corallococcus sp. Z5C101001 TaxID=2596829 RepID=UPI00117C5550|nr:hypothetical protein [Corallococcus sp. Z5C101001]TSC34373.1 hypothetical protein FOF48_04925 [Corallococcus sp. Z5C101001]